MNYPNNFDTPVFPEARKIAFSRTMAVWTLIAFFVVAALCGLLLWSVHSKRLAPFLISIHPAMGEWTVVGENSGKARAVSATVVMQESVVGNFAQKWFDVSESERANASNWCKCERDSCANPNARDFSQAGGPRCYLCCMSGDSLFRVFNDSVLPEYRALAEMGQVWRLDDDSMVISPLPGLSDSGGLWHVAGKLESNVYDPISIEAFVRVARNEALYPLTMGYYVADFNAYATALGAGGGQ